MKARLFGNNVKFDVIVSASPEPIVRFFGDEGLLEPKFTVIAPSDIKSDSLRNKRVIADHRALSLRDAALCSTVLELPAQWPESKEIEAGFVRVRRERPYLDEIAQWARERAENDEYARSVVEDLDSAERAILIAQKVAVRALAPMVARRIIYNHPNLGDTDFDTPERRAYHSDVFGVIKRILGLSQDEPLDLTIADIIFKECDDAWVSKPFPPEWVRDDEGHYAIRTWWGRFGDGSPDIGFINRGTPFDHTSWERVDSQEVPNDVMADLKSMFEDAWGRWQHARAAEMGNDIEIEEKAAQ